MAREYPADHRRRQDLKPDPIAGWPLTEYQLFQFSYGYPPSLDAGEVIQVADQTEHPELTGLDDFWLFEPGRRSRSRR